jgi:S1-C subfamily serine protease
MNKLLMVVGLVLMLPRWSAADQAQDDKNLYLSAVRSAVWVVKGSTRAEMFETITAGRPSAAVVSEFGVGGGSGSVIDREHRLVLTNAHVAEQYNEVFVVFPLYYNNFPVTNQKIYWTSDHYAMGKVLAVDWLKDLALFRLDKLPPGIPGLRLAEESPKVGDRLHSIGNPAKAKRMWVFRSGKLLESKQTKAMEHRPGETKRFLLEARMLRLDWESQPGESGSPILNEQGELAGVLWGGRDKKTAATDLSEVKAFLNSEEVKEKIAQLPVDPPPARKARRVPPQPVNPAPARPADPPETEADRKLRMAKSLADAGVKAKARDRLQEIIDQYPGTPAAKKAAALLEELDGRPDK